MKPPKNSIELNEPVPGGNSPKDRHLNFRIQSLLFEKLEQRKANQGSQTDMSAFLRGILEKAVQPENESQVSNSDINLGFECLNAQLKTIAEVGEANRAELLSLKEEFLSMKADSEFFYLELLDLLTKTFTVCLYTLLKSQESLKLEEDLGSSMDYLRIHFENRLRSRKGMSPLPLPKIAEADSFTRTENQNPDTMLEQEIPF